ncbi:MAG: YihY/virulence factor BrkB family protein [Cyclobacteriaceae bacterium]|nr:YihY/virulence factor BrkB family protein [Cyclobacteriaceae bacterium]
MSNSRQIRNNRGIKPEKSGITSLKDLKGFVSRVMEQIKHDHVQVVSAGVAFYFFLALFPTFAAIISIYGLVMDAAHVEQQMSQIATNLPDQTQQMLSGILHRLAGQSDQTLGWSLVISILISFWSANKGTSAVFEGVNIAYNEIDERNFFRKNGITILFTIGGIIAGFLCIIFVVGFPAFIDTLGLPSFLQTGISWLRWLLMAGIIILALGLIYRIAPDRKKTEFRWLNWGAIIATILWVLGSMLFTLYVNNFGSYEKTYGSFAAVIILMLWFFLTAFIILLGAEINSEMERQGENNHEVLQEEALKYGDPS